MSVGSEVFAGQPQLNNSLLKSLFGSFHHLAWRVAPQISSGVLRLAVGAVVQTASVDRDYLDETVLSYLWQVQRSSAHFLAVYATLAIESDCISCQRWRRGRGRGSKSAYLQLVANLEKFCYEYNFR